jgi:hypothetical protein
MSLGKEVQGVGVSRSIGPKLRPWSRFRRMMYMNTGGLEFSVDKIGFWNS